MDIKIPAILLLAGGFLGRKYVLPFLTNEATSALLDSNVELIDYSGDSRIIDDSGFIIRGPGVLKLTKFDKPFSIDGESRLLSLENYDKIEAGDSNGVRFFNIQTDQNVSSITSLSKRANWRIQWFKFIDLPSKIAMPSSGDSISINDSRIIAVGGLRSNGSSGIGILQNQYLANYFTPPTSIPPVQFAVVEVDGSKRIFTGQFADDSQRLIGHWDNETELAFDFVPIGDRLSSLIENPTYSEFKLQVTGLTRRYEDVLNFIFNPIPRTVLINLVTPRPVGTYEWYTYVPSS